MLKTLLDKPYLKNISQIVSLFGSVGTLFCCALPVLFVSLGMGAAFAGITALFPQIYWIMEYKTTLFITTGILLLISYLLIRHSRKLECPQSPQALACEKIKPKTQWMFWIASVTYVIGLAFSYAHYLI